MSTYTWKTLLGVGAVVGLLGAYFFLGGQSEDPQPANGLYEARSITHAHGLAVDVADPRKLYIATHEGLYVLMNESELYRIGEAKDDYMGFSVHPTAPDVFFTSGHPRTGGNLGVQRSDDAGKTWVKLADGASGPVDFHAMTVSPVDPHVLYGWYQGQLQLSTDGGTTWEVAASTAFAVERLAADPGDAAAVFAAGRQGLYVSADHGTTWAQMSDRSLSAFAVRPSDANGFLAYADELLVSNDRGDTWESIPASFDGKLLYIAFDPQNSSIVYALTEKNSVYKSEDGGTNWNHIR